MKTVTAEIMSEIDERAQKEYGIPAAALMENAGRMVAGEILVDNAHEKEKNVIILCGKGNNGGDGFVVGRYLSEAGFKNVEIFTFEEDEIKKGVAKNNFDRANCLRIKMFPLFDFIDLVFGERKPIIVDALFGTGFKGDLKGNFVFIGEKINNSGHLVYAVDIPSGLDATSGKVSKGCIRANKTVTFGLAKKGFYSGDGAKVCGEIKIVKIGFPEDLLRQYT